MNPDVYLFAKINGLAGNNGLFDSAAVFFAEYFGYVFFFCALVFLARDFKKNRLLIVQGLAAAIFARFGLVEIIRWLLPRSRPFVENHVNQLIDGPNCFLNLCFNQSSFPSGHAAFFFAFSAAVYFYNKKAGVLLFAASFLISLSRVFVGVHWPSDILAGALVGIFCAWLIKKLWRRFCLPAGRQAPQLE